MDGGEGVGFDSAIARVKGWNLGDKRAEQVVVMVMMLFACNKGTVGPQSLMCRPSYARPISCSCR